MQGMTPPAFPIPEAYSRVTDTDERRAVVRRLTDALYDYLTLDVVEMERGAKMRDEAMKRMADHPFFGPKPSPEMLIEASVDVESLRERIETAKEQMAQAGEKLGPLAALMEAGIIGPMEEMLRSREKYLSELQKRMEQDDVPG